MSRSGRTYASADHELGDGEVADRYGHLVAEFVDALGRDPRLFSEVATAVGLRPRAAAVGRRQVWVWTPDTSPGD